MTRGSPDEALVLRAPAKRRIRGTAVAGLAWAVAAAGFALYVLFSGLAPFPFSAQALVALIVLAWSAYVVPGSWRAVRRPPTGPEVLRLDGDGVTVSHLARGRTGAWSVDWRHVETVTVSEIAVPESVQERLGQTTKVVRVEVLDHRQVNGPADHRERLLSWARLTGTSTSRARLQALLALVGPEAVRRLATWLVAHRPEVGLSIDVAGPGEPTRAPPTRRVAVLTTEPELRAALTSQLAARGLRSEVVEAGDQDTLTERLRTCTALVAVGSDPTHLAVAAARSGLDRVLLASTDAVDTTALEASNLAWTALHLNPEQGADPQGSAADDSDGLAEAVIDLLATPTAVRATWRVGPDGVPVAAPGHA